MEDQVGVLGMAKHQLLQVQEIPPQLHQVKAITVVCPHGLMSTTILAEAGAELAQ
jgi:hypothetical protein